VQCFASDELQAFPVGPFLYEFRILWKAHCPPAHQVHLSPCPVWYLQSRWGHVLSPPPGHW